MKRKAPLSGTAASDLTTKMSHLSKMTGKAKKGVAADVTCDYGHPVAQIEGQEDFHKVYRPRGKGYGAGRDGDTDVEVRD